MNTENDRRSPLTARLELLATILLIVVALLVGIVTVWDRMYPQPTQAAGQSYPTPSTSPPVDPVSIEGATILGDKKARVALILFSEFECPYCARAARDVLPKLNRQYLRTGKVLLAWRHFPLPIHENARKAAEAAECARRQDKFWEFHDWAFEHQKELHPKNLLVAATTLGLDQVAFTACFEGQATARVEADLETANAVSVDSTPTWFIGVIQADGKVKVLERHGGAKRFEFFQRAIDKVIATTEGSG